MALRFGTLMPFVTENGWWLWFGLIFSVTVGAFGAANDVEAGRKHWAFQPITQPQVSTVKNRAWPRGDIDRFLLEMPRIRGKRG